MLVRDWMTENPMTLGLRDTVIEAAEVMRKQAVRQFPVIDDDGVLTGIVSDRDIRDAMPSKYLPGDSADQNGGGLAKLTAEDVMTFDPLHVSPTTPMDVVADMLARHKIGALPVVDEDGLLVGIISEVDLCRFLVSATGLRRGGPQFALRLEAKPGPLAALLEDLRGQSVRFHSVITSHDLEEAGSRQAYIRIDDLGEFDADSLTAYLKERYTLLFSVVDGVTRLP